MRRTARRTAAVCLITGLLAAVAPPPAWADTIRDRQWHLGFLNVAEAQRYSQGEGVTVAVIDTGVDATHPDLAGSVLTGTETFVGGTGDGHTDSDGHGTAMAGLIAGHGHGAGSGVLGIAPKALVLPIRSTNGLRSDHAAIARGIDYAVAHHAAVVCIAIGVQDFDDERQAVESALAAGVVLVAAAGNKPGDLFVVHPAAYPGVIAAAGVDQKGTHADASVTGPEVVLAAPAVHVMSAYSNGTYTFGTGTSDATAIIAGAAALVRSRYPSLSGAEVVRRLTTTATDKGVPGRDEEYGYGVVNLVDALTRDLPPPSATTPTGAAPAADSHSAAIATVVGILLLLTAIVGAAWWQRRQRHSG